MYPNLRQEKEDLADIAYWVSSTIIVFIEIEIFFRIR